MESLIQLDEQLFHIINHDWQNAFLDAVLPYWRDKKTWIPLYVLLAVFVVYKFKIKGLYFVLALALTVGVADMMSSKVLKQNVKRLRPCNNAELPFEVRAFDGCGGGYSFTSSHATNHFAIAMFISMTLGQYYRRIRLPFFLWAATIALAQVYVGVHYPLDVLCGALLGSLLAYILARIYLRWQNISIINKKNQV